MAKLDEVFDPSTIEDDSREYTPLPAGDYLLQITQDELKDNSKGTGRMLNLLVAVLDGKYAGRTFWVRITWTNTNAQAQSIGRKLLKKITESILGVGATISDTEELHYKPFVASLKIKPASGNFGASNEVNTARSASEGVPAKPITRAPVAALPAPAVAGARAPWPARTA